MGRSQLSHDEIRSLLHGGGDMQQPTSVVPANAAPDAWCLHGSGGNSVPGDQSRPAEATREDLDDVQAWKGLTKLVDCVRGALFEHLRAPLRVEIVAAQQLRFLDFLGWRQEPTFLATSNAAGEDQEIALDIGLSVLFPAINRMLGGRFEDDPIAARPLTRIETGLATRLADRLVAVLLASCGEVQPGRWKTSSENRALEYNLRTLEQEPMACVDLRVNLGSANGPLRIALPWGLFQRKADAKTRSAATDTDTVDVSVVLATTRLPRSELTDLQPGDLVASPLVLGQLFEIQLDGLTRFQGSLGTLAGQKAVRIEQIADAKS